MQNRKDRSHDGQPLTVAPNWPPPSYLQPDLWAVMVAVAGAAALATGPRIAVRAIGLDRATWPGIALGIMGTMALAAAAATVMLDRHNTRRPCL